MMETGRWIKSSESKSKGVEVMAAGKADAVFLRHAKVPHAAMMRFSHAEWRAFLAGVKNGEFDL